MITTSKTDIMTKINSEIDNSTISGEITLDAIEWKGFYDYILSVHGGFNKQAYGNVKQELDAGSYSYRDFNIVKEA